MVLGIGVDICEIERVREAIRRYGDRFKKRICTLAELQLADGLVDVATFYAGCFAAKEAMAKALGTGITDRVRWHDIEVLNHNASPPIMTLSGGALRRARWLASKRAFRIHLSIGYRGELAHAMVMIEAV
ncbi:holo-[acyl-carrier protein] synthase [Bosea sp. BE125]|uniref:holo-ACP synthase n=1 Tax=Bosea sp. BE125 TaxID=2817909 RepID=UPI002856EAD4|nr:holo-ACP synthase [Bosea sp. BE125]MDR6872069.1 holo-[acyl-carrier protein] synthase [Bosea sp. BE125]